MAKIEFVSIVAGLDSIEECRPKPAKNFIPEWFKSIPGADIESVRSCPSFPDYFSLGYVLPMWADREILYDSEKDSWSTFGSDLFPWTSHSNDQFLKYADAKFLGKKTDFIFKPMCPWRVITPPGWSVLQLPLFYHFNQEWSVLPGVIDTDIHHEINQQIMYHGSGNKIKINRGQPLALYIPFKRNNKLSLSVSSANEKQIKFFDKKDLAFKTKFFPNGLYRKMQRERDKNVR